MQSQTDDDGAQKREDIEECERQIQEAEAQLAHVHAELAAVGDRSSNLTSEIQKARAELANQGRGISVFFGRGVTRALRRAATISGADVTRKAASARADIRSAKMALNQRKRDLKAKLLAIRQRLKALKAKGRPTGTSASQTNLANQLRRLAELHAQGALTDQEFAAAKNRLLAT